MIVCRCVLALGCTYIPGPHQRTCQNVECANGAGRFARHNVPYPATDHGEVAHDNRQRGGVIALAVFSRAHTFLEIDITVVAKSRTQGAGMRIKRKQTGIHRRHQNTLAALLLIAI